MVRPAFFLLLLLAAMVPSAAAAHPRPDLWVAYAGTFGGGTTTSRGAPEGAVTVGQGGGRIPNFRMRLRAGGNPVAEVRSPGSFDRDSIHIRDAYDDLREGSEFANQQRFEGSIVHHLPTTAFRLVRPGRVDVRVSPEGRRYARCARQLLRASSDRLIAQAPTAPLRGVERRRRDNRLALAEQPRRGPSLLLQLLHLPMAPISGGELAKFEQRRATEVDRDRARRQHRWRSEQIRLAGREMGLAVDLMRDRRSPAARVCRTVSVTRVGRPVSDMCRIEGFIDTRDGWPIVISISRSVEATNRATSGEGVTFSRLAPLEGFVAPANPCAADS